MREAGRVVLPLSSLVLAAAFVVACGDSDDGEGGDAASPDASAPAGSRSDDVDQTTAPDADADSDGADDGDDAGASHDGDGDGEGDDGSGGATGDDVGDVLDGLDFGDGLAVVTIGDTVHQFALGGSSAGDGVTYLGVCRPLFGMIQAIGYDTGGAAITLDAQIPPPDWESYDDDRFDAPYIEIEDDEGDVAWAADLSLQETYPEAAGVSQLDDWSVDGNRASGTATFIPITGFGAPTEGAEPVEGSFEIQCADE